MPHVVEEAAGREPLREGERRAGGQRQPVARHHGVAVEERHRHVEHVVAGDREHLGQHHAGEPHLLVGHPDRLRGAGGAGGEDEHEQAVIGGLRRWWFTSRNHRRVPPRRVDPDHPHLTQVEPVEQAGVRRVGEHQLAVAGADVGEQGITAAGRVEPHHDVASERRGGQCHRHLHGVVEQHADVRRAVGVQERAQRRGARGGLVDVLGPGPGAAPGREAGTVVVSPLEQELPEGGQRKRVTRARRRARDRCAAPARSCRRRRTRTASPP